MCFSFKSDFSLNLQLHLYSYLKTEFFNPKTVSYYRSNYNFFKAYNFCYKSMQVSYTHGWKLKFYLKNNWDDKMYIDGNRYFMNFLFFENINLVVIQYFYAILISGNNTENKS